MTTRGQINSNFYQIVDVDVDGNPTQVKPAYVPAVDHANTANYANFAGNAFSVTGSNVVGTVANATYATDAGHATVSDSANSVSLGNVVGAGNIAGINLDGNSSHVLSGIGTWVEQTGGGGTPGGSNTQVQYNDGVGFAGSANLTFDVTTGILTASKVSGNGSLLTNLTGANVTGVVGNATHANVSDLANSVQVANVIGIGNIATVNLSGNGAQTLLGNGVWGALPNTATANYANFAGNVTVNSQPNITSVGTLTSLTVTGNITGGNITGGNLVTSNYFSGNGSLLTSITGSNVTGQVANALVAGTVYTNAQPNITSLGNLTSMSLNNTVTPITANVGQMFWDTSEHTVSLGMENGVTQQIGLENYIYVKASSAITDGQVVMFTGASGDNVLAAPADVTSVGFMSEYVIGVATQSIATNGFGYITTFGKVHGLNTNSFNVGDILWLSTSTPGLLTNVQPTDPAFQIQVAAVTKKSAGDGHIQVRVTPYWALNKLTDVTLTTPTTGQALIYNGSNVWINGNPQQANIANVANSVSGSNVTGQVANALVAGTVYTNSQPNITSVGTLTGLTSNGVVDFTNASNVSLGTVSNVHISGGTANYVLQTNGSGTLSWVSPGSFSTSAAGSNTEVQFNNGGVFGASNAFTFTSNTTNTVMTLGSTTTDEVALNFIVSGTSWNTSSITKLDAGVLTGGALEIRDDFYINVITPHIDLGPNSNVVISGGTSGDVLSTDGLGGLSWVPMSGGGTPGGSDTYIQFNNSGTFGGEQDFTFNIVNVGSNIAPTVVLGNSAISLTDELWNGANLSLKSYKGLATFTRYSNVGLTISDTDTSGLGSDVSKINLVANTITLGSNANINITGGSTGQVLTTNGSGNLSWTTPSGGSSTTDFTPSFLLGGM